MRSKWLTRRAVLASIALVIWAPGCLLAGWWQATVALSGNTLSYLYTVEWPAFAVLGVVVWWHLVHLDPETVGARGLARLQAARAGGGAPDAGPHDQAAPRGGDDGGDDDGDDELRAYNEYLASLRDRPKTWLRR